MIKFLQNKKEFNLTIKKTELTKKCSTPAGAVFTLTDGVLSKYPLSHTSE